MREHNSAEEDFDNITTSEEISNLPYAPIEIWNEIVQNIDDVKDLKSLSLTCKILNHLVRRRMWRVAQLHKLEGIEAIVAVPVEDLNINYISCEDSDLQRIAQISSLRKFVMSGISHLAPVTRLEKLNISWCRKFSSTGISYLTQLRLEELNVRGCAINDSDLFQIGQIDSLTKLVISANEDVTDTGISYLSKLNHLQCLDIGRCIQVTSEGLTYIKHLPLTKIHMQRICLDSHLAVVGSFRRLQMLDIRYSGEVTNTGVSHLSALAELRCIKICKCRLITEAGKALLADQVKISYAW